MQDSALVLVILNGQVYPVKRDQVEDLIEDFAQ